MASKSYIMRQDLRRPTRLMVIRADLYDTPRIVAKNMVQHIKRST